MLKPGGKKLLVKTNITCSFKLNIIQAQANHSSPWTITPENNLEN